MRLTHILVLLALVIPNQAPAASPQYEQTQETGNFIFHHTAAQAPLVRDLMQAAETYRNKVGADLGVELDRPVEVYVVEGLNNMRQVAPPGARVPSWAAGMAFGRLKRIILRTDSRAGQAQNLKQVFVHELAHLALSRAVGHQRVPRWFHEGFAIYQSGEWSLGRVTALASGVVGNRLFSLQALTESFPSAPPDVELAYAQSIDFVAFLLKKHGRAQFHLLIEHLSRGWTFINAVEEAYDSNIFRIEQEWHADLKMRFTWLPLLTGTATLWFFASLVLVAAYLRKRRNRALALEQMDDDEFDDGPPTPLTPTSP